MPRATVIIDTVGFIRKLPHHLVASFRSTMEEAVSADLVLHVIDGSHPQFHEQREIGEQVLDDLGVDRERVIEVYNKVDQFDDHFMPRREASIAVSALTGEGIDRLIAAIGVRERADGEMMRLHVPHEELRMAAKLHELAEVYEQTVTEQGTIFRVWVPHHAVHLFEPYSAEQLLESARLK
jgi:GTPase